MTKITVYDYTGAISGSMPWHVNPNHIPLKMEVDAECVGGDDGVLAFFEYENKFCVAAGDDGHWWLIYVCSKQWKDQIKQTMVNVK